MGLIENFGKVAGTYMAEKEKLKSALTYLGEIDKRQKTAYISDETELVHFISHVLG